METEPYPPPVRPLAAFAVPNFRRFVLGQSVSLIGSWTETVAQVLGAVVLCGVIQLWMVFAVALAFGMLTAVDNPARLAFVPEMVGPKLIRNLTPPG
jgi:uncharacterized membrane protein